MTTTHSSGLSAGQIKAFLAFQQNEITGYHLYTRLAKRIRDNNNAMVVELIGQEITGFNGSKSNRGF